MFYKFKETFDIEMPIEIGQILVYFGSCDPRLDLENFTGVVYRKILSSHEPFLKLLPRESWQQWTVAYMEMFNVVPPHIDNNIRSNINFYLQSDDCTTNYYNLNKSNPEVWTLNTQTSGRMFKQNDLTIIDSFIAKDGEIFLLDVTKIHSVVSNKDAKIRRKAISVHSGIPFEKVVQMLTIQGN